MKNLLTHVAMRRVPIFMTLGGHGRDPRKNPFNFVGDPDLEYFI